MSRSEQTRWVFVAFVGVAVTGLVIDFPGGFPIQFGAIAELGGFR
ncbi:MAG: hypothetical protein AB7G40_07875 [Hyphomonadaceae bacterium]